MGGRRCDSSMWRCDIIQYSMVLMRITLHLIRIVSKMDIIAGVIIIVGTRLGVVIPIPEQYSRQC